jgi:hypothetical protein
MFSVGTREIALSRRNAVHNSPAEHNQTLNIEAGLLGRPERGSSTPQWHGRGRYPVDGKQKVRGSVGSWFMLGAVAGDGTADADTPDCFV